MRERIIFETELAKKYLDKMFEQFDKTKQIAPGIPSEKLFKEKGIMFGVLVCEDKFKNQIILKAFSSQLFSKYLVEGFVPPALDVSKFNEIVDKYDFKIKQLTKEIKVNDS